jgi:hypothetical protein
MHFKELSGGVVKRKKKIYKKIVRDKKEIIFFQNKNDIIILK